MKQYLATIPGNPKKATTKYTTDPDFEFNAANEQNNFTTKMETPQSWIFVGVLGNTSYTVKNRLITDVAEQVLSKRLLTKIREEMGATYSIGANGMLSRTANKYNTFFQVACPVNPDKRDEVIKEIKNIIDESTKTITADEIKPAIEFLAKENEKELKENSDLASHMLATHLNGVNVYKERGAIIPTITVAEVQDYLKHLVDQNLIRIVVLNPEETK